MSIAVKPWPRAATRALGQAQAIALARDLHDCPGRASVELGSGARRAHEDLPGPGTRFGMV